MTRFSLFSRFGHRQKHTHAKHARVQESLSLPVWSAKNVLLVTATIAIVVAAIGGTIAWLTASDKANNAFAIAEANPTLEEDFNEGDIVKRDVFVSSSDKNAPMYVRALVNIVWQAEDGTVVWTQASDLGSDGVVPDYEISWGDVAELGTSSPDDGTWIKGDDGYFYWSKPLQPGGDTGHLINELYVYKDLIESYGDNRSLRADIAIQGIQADPKDAAIEAWGVTVADDGTLTPSSGSAANENEGEA